MARPERKRDAERKAATRRQERDLAIPKIVNSARRRRCEKRVDLWLSTYLPEVFYRRFSKQQLAMIKEILAAAKFGGDKSIAAPRSDGKTTIAECVILYCMLVGILRFPLIVGATGPDAARILDHVKEHLERNDLLYEDYPEVCHPIRALEGAPQRAGMQTVNGRRTYLQWKQDYIVLPDVPKRGGNKAAGAILMTRGLDASIRGIRVGSTRPDFVLVDDPETRESVKSEEQTKTRRLTIEQDLAGLGGSDKKLARVMLTTIMRRATAEGNPTISYQYTDRKQKPSWHGERYRVLEEWPDREDLWNEYCQMRQQDQRRGDKHARRAHQFYLDNRELMDAGAIVTDEGRFAADPMPDGTTLEASALQRCYNVIADRGRESFDTEYQNDPPEEAGPIESGITPQLVQRQVSGYRRLIIPPGCTVLTHAIDVGKWKLHWVVRAWAPDATGYTIDYGRTAVYDQQYGTDEGLDKAITAAILRRMEEFQETQYMAEDGEAIRDTLTLIDARYRTDAVFAACAMSGMGVYPIMGFGQSAGTIGIRFTPAQNRNATTIPGDNWKLVKRGKIWLVEASADHWKAWEHDRWMTAPGKAGCLSLWGERDEEDPERLSSDQRDHGDYAHHICAEIEIEEPYKEGIRRRWKQKSKENHWLDGSCYCNVAASIKGIRLAGPITRRVPKRLPGMPVAGMAAATSRPSARELAARAMRG